MTSMRDTIIPKSDQLNADDLIGGQIKTIKITKVAILAGEQPVALHYEGDNGKPYKPGKSMRRVLVSVWGDDGNLYIGRSMTLYRDEKIKFGGEIVGGIRISHMSHITESVTMALTATRASRKPFTVQPLGVTVTNAGNGYVEPSMDDSLHDIANAPTLEGLEFKFKNAYRTFHAAPAREKLTAAKEKRKLELTTQETTNASVS